MPLRMMCFLFLVLPQAYALPTEWQQVESGTLFIEGPSGFVEGPSGFKESPSGSGAIAPLLETDVKIDITGVIARVRLSQTFSNPGQEWVEAVYVFPLPEESAVDHMRLLVGERIIEGKIKEREQARKVYEKARAEGKRTSLVEQQRPNLFTTRVANIPPGESVVVEIAYQQTVQRTNNDYSLRFPMTITPRYIPGQILVNESGQPAPGGNGWAANTDAVPDASHITPPIGKAAYNHHPVNLTVDIQAGFELASLESLEHGVEKHQLEPGHYQLVLAADRHRANADFRLQWQPVATTEPQAAFFTETWRGEVYGLLMVNPPSIDSGAKALPREVIFIIDTSGSMGGAPLPAAKAALATAVERLKDNDTFNIIAFNSSYSTLWETPRRASEKNLSHALAYVRRLQANGGTEMAGPLRASLCGQCGEVGRVRQVIFITDGAVGNEEQLFGLVKDRIGRSRLFTVGIGGAPNSYFMRKAALAGRGTFHYISNGQEIEAALQGFFEKLENPLLGDIQVQAQGLAPDALAPATIADLYQGEPVVSAMKLDKSPREVTLSGVMAGSAVQAVVPLSGEDRKGIHSLWARLKISEYHDEYATAKGEQRKQELKNEITDLALAHHLVSPFTSLVAVDKTPVRPQSETLDKHSIPANSPKGTQFGLAPTATPGPLLLRVGLLCLCLAAALAGLMVWKPRWLS